MNTIDRRTVEMQFKNQQFESGAKQTMSTLDKLKQALQFKGVGNVFGQITTAANKVDMSSLSKSVETIQNRFSNLGIIGITVLQNLANQATEAGKRIISSLTIDPIKTGFQEYETQINAIQTILANTQSKGTGLKEVNAALDELNRYADMTIYNFTEMTRNIGTFTAAGVDLDTSTNAIKGIANLAAISGSNAEQASTAMYQLSQALASGTVKLMDWNSVVNAGMGGQVFQDALKETARVHGVKIDEMINKEGSFRETLKEGWLTSSILTETLAKFTGDLTEEQLRSIGYTDEQIQGIMQLGKTANDAATKVKTFSQLFDTLKEAAQSGWSQSWEIIVGDFEEAKELLTSISDVIGGIINESSEARNQVLQGWKDLGGRTDLIDSFKNIFNAVIALVKPIRDAFAEIIPPITAEKLKDLTAGFKSFTSSLIISESTADKLRTTFKGIFSVFSIAGKIIGSIITVFSKVISSMSGVAVSFLNVTAIIGDFITKINETIDRTKIFSSIGNTISSVFSSIENTINNFLSSLNFENLGVDLANAFDNLTSAISNFFSKGFDLDGLAKSFTTIFGAGVFAAIGTQVVKFSKNVSDAMGIIKDTISAFGAGEENKIVGILDGLTDSLSALQNSLKANTLFKIAAAIGILSLALNKLSKINVGDLTKALVGIAVGFQIMMVSLETMSIILNGASIKGLISASAGLILISTAVLILSQAVKVFSKMSLEELAKGLTAVGVAMTEFAIFSQLIKPVSINVASKSMMSLSAAMIVLGAAVAIFGSMDLKSLAKGLGSVGILLAEIALFTNVSANSVKILASAAALTVMSVAILGLSASLKIFGSMSLGEIGKSLGVLAGSLAILVVAMEAMGNARVIAGSAALTICAIALMALTPALKLLGSMSLGEVAIALGTLAGAFAIFGVAGILLGPLTPILLALSAAIGIFGAAVLAAGVGVAAFGAGLTMIATAITTLGTGATVALTALTSLIPMFIEQIGIGILKIIELVKNSFSSIVAAIVTIITGVCDAIIQSIPKIIETVSVIIQAFCQFVIENIPLIIETAFIFITSFLQGIRDHVFEITIIVTDIIINFLNALAIQLPMIIQAGWNFILSFINGLADSVRTNMPLLIDAIINLGTSIIDGLVNTITGGEGSVTENFGNVITNVISSLGNFLGDFMNKGVEFINNIIQGIGRTASNLLSNVGGLIQSVINKIASFLGSFLTKGVEFITNIISGIGQMAGNLLSSVGELIQSTIDHVAGFVSNFLSLGHDLIQGLIDGVKEKFEAVRDAAVNVVSGAVNAVKNFLGIASPSKLFASFGRFIDLGLAQGIAKYSKIPEKSSRSMSSKVVSAMSNAMSSVENFANDLDFTPTITPILDVSNFNKEFGKLHLNRQLSIDVSNIKAHKVIGTSLRNNNNNSNIVDTNGSNETIINNNFTQNNYSPKPLSRIDIYRQSKNLFARTIETSPA